MKNNVNLGSKIVNNNVLVDPDGASGIVANVQRFTIHDGPGIRTELFLKGCPLRCEWCSNPECYIIAPQVGVARDKCIGCGYCLKACSEHGKNALITDNMGVIGIDRKLCDNCMLCEKECYSGNLVVFGERMTVEEAMDVILRDRVFYDKSGGGVTLSGGEPLMQWRFCREILKACKAEGINTCVESAFHVDPKAIEGVAPYTDLFITDMKQMDTEIHKKYTGVGNELILSNIKKVTDMEIPLVIRIPIIPGFNDTEEHIDGASDFILNELSNKPLQVQLLKYRPLGEEKADRLGLPQLMKAMDIEDQDVFVAQIKGFVQRMKDRGIPATAGSREEKIEQ